MSALAPDWKDYPETWIGMKGYCLLVADDSRHSGVIVALAPLTYGGKVLSDNVPTIALDDGRTVHGYDCWWTPSEGLIP